MVQVTFLFALVLGFIWAFTLITVMAQNPTTGFQVPWVQQSTDQHGRPQKGRINISGLLKGMNK